MKTALYLLLLIAAPAFGQLGNLRVTDSESKITHDADPHLLDIIAVQIYFNDTTKVLDSIVKRGFEIEMDSISCGKYSSKLFINGELKSINYFTVNSNSISCIEVNSKNDEAWEVPYSKALPDSTPNRSVMETELFALYGRGFIEDKNYPIKNKFTLGYNTIAAYKICKHFAVGYNVGLSVFHAYFGKDSTLTAGKHIFERYYQFNANIGPFIRLWQKGNIDELSKRGMFIDLGVNYAFPFVCHYTVKDKNVKTMKSDLHEYTDFFAFSRIGYNHFSLLIQYRLMDYIKGYYPELPKLQIGISMPVGVETAGK